MATTLSADWKMYFAGRYTRDSPNGPAAIEPLNVDKHIPSGTASGKADLVGAASASISGSSNADVDLRAVTGADGSALSGAELALLVIGWPSTADGELRIKQAASNGLALVSGTTDYVSIQPGGRFVYDHVEANGIAMDATNKSINLANQGASAASYTLYTLQRSA